MIIVGKICYQDFCLIECYVRLSKYNVSSGNVNVTFDSYFQQILFELLGSWLHQFLFVSKNLFLKWENMSNISGKKKKTCLRH